MRGHSWIERSAHHEVIVVMFAGVRRAASGERGALRLFYR